METHGFADRPRDRGAFVIRVLSEPSMVAVAETLGHHDIVVEPDLSSSQRWTDERRLEASVAPKGKGNRHTSARDRRVSAELMRGLTVSARALCGTGCVSGSAVVRGRRGLSAERCR